MIYVVCAIIFAVSIAYGVAWWLISGIVIAAAAGIITSDKPE